MSLLACPMRALATASALTALLALGCQKHGDKAGDAEAGDAHGGEHSEHDASTSDRVPALQAPAAGIQPAFMDGAIASGSCELALAQDLLHSLPLGPAEARDFAELGEVIGADPRVDDLLAHFAIPADARLSISIRPVLAHLPTLRERATSKELGFDAGARPDPDPKPSAARPQSWTQLDTPPPEDPALAEPPSPEQQAVMRQLGTLGLHVRAHLPTTDPARLEPLFAGLRQAFSRVPSKAPGHPSVCAALAQTHGPLRLCGSQGEGTLIARDVEGGVRFDLYLTFASERMPESAEYLAALESVSSTPRASADPEAAALRGDCNALIHAPAMVETMRAKQLASQLSRWIAAGPSAGERYAKADAALASLHDTSRLFEGAKLELRVDDGQTFAELAWLPARSAPASAAELFTLAEIDADVPSAAALCEGALVCGRSRGLPARHRFIPLTTGVYADPETLFDTLERYDDESTLILLLETWPNALGTLGLLPGQLAEPPESFFIENALGVADRALGFGVSVRSLQETRGSLTGDWVGYVRSSAVDLNALSGFLQLIDVRLSPAQIPDVPGRVETTVLPNRDVAGNYYAIFDPQADTGSWGWAMLADSDDRVRWLSGLPRDDGATPLAYVEIPDLWRLLSVSENFREEFGFAQRWLSQRWIRAQLSSSGAALGPSLRVALGKL
ncbi:hypothetical protein G6O69_04990 [Pseudenhygromyxa sp. WMMC2535]|uniref:hypothetical protein n=1 Tax=Pseudenhygromyxa sp. WMMC2535 TaxID=2712867 RepID=UPI001594E905|nr:hypothetical protein [Pseudenhygromyxa sp. WMMC2535]NVB37176.1 hypothetical protein [Pseudenhygromyxa sp. WMMC2535]